MIPEEQAQLTQFLTTFDAIGLGEGDLVAGVNTLAAMFCTVANVARPGSAIMCPDRKFIKVGNSLLVSGSLSSSLITDDVITELRICQNNITEHLQRARTTKTREDTADRPKFIKFAEKNVVNQSESMLLSMLKEERGGMSSTADKWAMVTQSPPNPAIDEITSSPKIVVSASTPAELSNLLQGTHLSHPLALLGLNHTSSTERMSDLCTAVMSGRLPDGDNGKTAQGNLIITDPDDVLRELARNADENTAYLGRCIWLVDGAAGPEFPEHEPKASPLGNVADKFKSSLSRAFGKRLNHKSEHPVIHELDMIQAQCRWVEFLKGIEDSLPGISGHARNLLATLVFGALELTSRYTPAAGAPNPLSGIEAFARFLIHRMANARNVMIYSAREARNDQLKESILHKLEAGPHTVRDLTRRFSRLTTEPCRELLADLEKQGKVQNHDGEWSLTNSTTQPLTLDI